MNGYNMLISLKNQVVEFGKAEMIHGRVDYISSNGYMYAGQGVWIECQQDKLEDPPPNLLQTLGAYPPAYKLSRLETVLEAGSAYWGNVSIAPKSDLRPRHWQR